MTRAAAIEECECRSACNELATCRHLDFTMTLFTMQTTRQHHQPTQKRQSCRHERRERRDDQAIHQESQETLTTILQQSHQIKRRTSTDLAGHDDQSHIQERVPIISIQQPAHLFDPHLSHTLQPSLLQTFTTHSRRQPVCGPSRLHSDQSNPRQTVRSRSGNSDRHPPSGTSHFASQPLNPKRHSTQLSTEAHGGLCENKALSSQTKLLGPTTSDQQRATILTDVNSKQFYLESFADDTLLRISGSLKHTTTMLDDLTTAHSLQLHSTKTKNISNTTSTPQKNTEAVQGMNIEILPRAGKNKYLSQLITFKMRVGNIHELRAGVDTNSSTQFDTISLLRFRNGSDD